MIVENFQMPGVGIVPNYDSRIEVMREYGEVDRDIFLQKVYFPTLKSLGVTRQDIATQVRFRKDFSGGLATYKRAVWRRFANACRSPGGQIGRCCSITYASPPPSVPVPARQPAASASATPRRTRSPSAWPAASTTSRSGTLTPSP